jgi:hypothetical protein
MLNIVLKLISPSFKKANSLYQQHIEHKMFSKFLKDIITYLKSWLIDFLLFQLMKEESMHFKPISYEMLELHTVTVILIPKKMIEGFGTTSLSSRGNVLGPALKKVGI